MNPKLKKIILNLQNQLTNSGDVTKVDALAKYFKHKVLNRGNNSPTIQQTYRSLKSAKDYLALSHNEKFTLATEMIKSDYMDDKQIGCSILSEIHKKVSRDDIESLVDIIRANKCNEWGTCDTLASKVFRPYSLLNKDNCYFVAEYRDDENIWMRRISCVTYITRVKKCNKKPNFEGFIDLMFTICESCIKYEERFNQLATGWLLRELSLVELSRFKKFFYRYFNYFSREAIRYAVEKLPVEERKKIMSYRKD
jgi:3-methyladenine DNA glycosylase AlkD